MIVRYTRRAQNDLASSPSAIGLALTSRVASGQLIPVTEFCGFNSLSAWRKDSAVNGARDRA